MSTLSVKVKPLVWTPYIQTPNICCLHSTHRAYELWWHDTKGMPQWRLVRLSLPPWGDSFHATAEAAQAAAQREWDTFILAAIEPTQP